MHRVKGLEFDHVIGRGSKRRSGTALSCAGGRRRSDHGKGRRNCGTSSIVCGADSGKEVGGDHGAWEVELVFESSIILRIPRMLRDHRELWALAGMTDSCPKVLPADRARSKATQRPLEPEHRVPEKISERRGDESDGPKCTEPARAQPAPSPVLDHLLRRQERPFVEPEG